MMPASLLLWTEVTSGTICSTCLSTPAPRITPRPLGGLLIPLGLPIIWLGLSWPPAGAIILGRASPPLCPGGASLAGGPRGPPTICIGPPRILRGPTGPLILCICAGGRISRDEGLPNRGWTYCTGCPWGPVILGRMILWPGNLEGGAIGLGPPLNLIGGLIFGTLGRGGCPPGRT